MSLLNALLNAQNGGAVQALSQQFGLGQNQTVAALQNLVPALAAGMRRNAGSADGLSSLLGALGAGDHQRYLNDPNLLGANETRDDGNAILGHLLGSKDVSRQVAGQAAQSTGIDAGVLKKMLPVVATMAMGAMSRQSNQLGLGGGAAPAPQNAAGLLSFLDADKDGSIVDDLFKMAKKLF